MTFEDDIKALEAKDKITREAITHLEGIGFTIIPPANYHTTDTSEFYVSRYLMSNKERYGTDFRIAFFSFLRSDFLNSIKGKKDCIFAGFSADIPSKIKDQVEKHIGKDIRSLDEYGAYIVVYE